MGVLVMEEVEGWYVLRGESEKVRLPAFLLVGGRLPVQPLEVRGTVSFLQCKEGNSLRPSALVRHISLSRRHRAWHTSWEKKRSCRKSWIQDSSLIPRKDLRKHFPVAKHVA